MRDADLKVCANKIPFASQQISSFSNKVNRFRLILDSYQRLSQVAKMQMAAVPAAMEQGRDVEGAFLEEGKMFQLDKDKVGESVRRGTGSAASGL